MTILAGGAAPGAVSVARADVVWRGDFETQDFSQWNYELNPEGLSIVDAPVAEGSSAMRAELTSERSANGGNIFRTELQHKPEASRASDGEGLYFGWSVYLPEPLPAGEDQDYQLAYFEREYNGDYRQVFSLHVVEQKLFLNFNQPQTEGDVDAGLLEMGQWHRIVFYVKWSSDANEGYVSLWLDGVKQVDEAHARTFIDAPAFIQLGLLKNPPAPPQPVVLYVDAAMEGDTYEDVSLGIPESEGSTAPPEGSVSPEPAPVDSTDPTDSVSPVEPDASSIDVEPDVSSDGESTGADTDDPGDPFVPNPEPLPTASAPAASTAPAPTALPSNPSPGATSAPNVPSGAAVNPNVPAPSTPQLMPSVAPTASPSSVGTATPPASSTMSEAGPASDTGGCGVTSPSTQGWNIMSILGLGLITALTAARRRRSNG